MILIHNIILLLFYCVINTWAQSQVDFESDDLYEDDRDVKLLDNSDVYLPGSKNNLGDEVVTIQVYYESMSLSARYFFQHLLVVAFHLNRYLDIQTYPFGNAKIIDKNDTVEFECEHGPAECYGNKLHACALFNLWGGSLALEFNNCLMDIMRSGSNDETADWCGQKLNLGHIMTSKIKSCAKGTKGTRLLLYYGEVSKREKFSFIPHVLINGKKYNYFEGDLLTNVCKAFTKPPRPCPDEY